MEGNLNHSILNFMEKNRKYVRNNVHWGNLISLMGTLAITVFALPVFIWKYGAQLNWWVHGGLFVGLYIFSGTVSYTHLTLPTKA